MRMRCAWLTALALAMGWAPASAQQPSGYEQAVAARQAGDPTRAVALLQPWIASNPADTDARVQLGYALLALGRNAEAAAQFRAVLAAAPDYVDAREGLRLARERSFPAAARRGFVLVEGAMADVDGALPDWYEATIVAQLPVAGQDSLDLRGSWYRRFGLEDVEALVGYSHQATRDTWLRGSVSAAPSADFRPEVGLAAGIDHRLSAGPSATIVGFDASWRKFPAQDVWTFSPALTQYFAGGNASVLLRANALAAEDDKLRLGGLGRFDYYATDRSRAYVGAGFGPDTDLGVVTDTRTLFGGGELGLGGALSVTGSVSREWRDGPADRTEARLGLKVAL